MCHNQWLFKVESVWETCTKDLAKLETAPSFIVHQIETTSSAGERSRSHHTSLHRVPKNRVNDEDGLLCGSYFGYKNEQSCLLLFEPFVSLTLKITSLHSYVCNDKIRLFVCKSLPRIIQVQVQVQFIPTYGSHFTEI